MHIDITPPKAPQARRVPSVRHRIVLAAWHLFEVCVAVAAVAGIAYMAEHIAATVGRLS